MSQLLEDHPHFQLLQSESYVSPREREWERWVKKVEKLLGHNLDGNQQRDGYSLDYAYDAFRAGETPAAYAEEVRQDKAALAGSI